MDTITGVGKDGQRRTFELRWEKDPIKERWIFRAYIPELASGEFYEASFEADPIDHATIRSVGTHAHAPEYREVGLPEAIILKAAGLLGKRIVSSRNRKPKAANEWRTAAATKPWQRLVSQGLAAYDEERDTFTLTAS